MSNHNHGFIPQLDIQQLEPGLYEFQVEFAGEVMDTVAGFRSISEAIEAAAGVTGDILGFQVSYGGLIVGTYRLEMLRANAEAVAQRAIETVAAFSDY